MYYINWEKRFIYFFNEKLPHTQHIIFCVINEGQDCPIMPDII